MTFGCRLGHEHGNPDFADRCDAKYIDLLEAVVKVAAEAAMHLDGNWYLRDELKLALSNLDKAKARSTEGKATE